MSNHRLWLRYDQLDTCMLMLLGLMVRPLSAGGPASARRPEDFVLVLGAVERVAVLAWTCDLHLVGSQCLRRPRSMRPRHSGDLPYQWLVVTHPDEWEAVPIKWLPPVAQVWRQHVHALAGSTGAAASSSSSSASREHTPLAAGAFIQEVEEPCSLLEVAAQQGFRGLGVTALRSLARYFKLELKQSASMFDVLMALVRHALPGASEEDIALILARYTQAEYPGQEDLMSSEAMKECFGPGDAKELDNFAESSKSIAPMVNDIKQYIAKVVAERRTNESANSGASRRAGARQRRRGRTD